MEIVNLLHFGNRSELRQWLKENHNKEKCCWVITYRSKWPPEWPAIPYIEAVARWAVGSAPLSSPPQKPLDSTEHGQMYGS